VKYKRWGGKNNDEPKGLWWRVQDIIEEENENKKNTIVDLCIYRQQDVAL
jgi:hypothetical protein